jgi:hypothetical protein
MEAAMLTYALLAAYAAVAGWFFWLDTRATTTQSLIVSLSWPLALVLLLVILLWADGDENIPE